MICTDLWPNIISYCSIRDLCTLSKASPLFDPLIRSLGMPPILFSIEYGQLQYQMMEPDHFMIIEINGSKYFLRRHQDDYRLNSIKVAITVGSKNIRMIHTVNEITNDMIHNCAWFIDIKKYRIIVRRSEAYTIMYPTEIIFTKDKKVRIHLGMSYKDLDILSELITAEPLVINQNCIDINTGIFIKMRDIGKYKVLYHNGKWIHG